MNEGITVSNDARLSGRPRLGGMTDTAQTITMYGADWCRDCIRTKKQLDELGVAYTYVDLIEDVDAVEVAKRISGRTNIPVVVYPDDSHQVEPTNAEVDAKLRELAII
jgi:mycoredoxin